MSASLSSRGPLRIATRKSPLALWQARHIADRIQHAAPDVTVQLVELTTEGDRFLSGPLSQVGGKGLFVKEVEQAVLSGAADLAVHSLKDMTSTMPEGLTLGALPEREDPRDAWVSHAGTPLDALPSGAQVGTSSLRRACQLLARRPDLQTVSIRGNVQTRLEKAKALAGTVLAHAGLKRLALQSVVTEVLAPEVSLPAIGQGILAVQCRASDEALLAVLSRLDHAPTRAAATAERALLKGLEGGCTVPLAGYATLEANGALRLRGLVGRPDGSLVIRGERVGPASSGAQMGEALASELLARGGARILASFGHSNQVPES